MKKHNLFRSIIPFFGISLIVLIGIAVGAPKEVKVQIHTVEGSGITEGQVRGWVDKANAIDANSVKYVVDSNHVYGPNTPYDPNKNDPCRINIWGLDKKPWGDPNVSGAGGGTVWVVPGDGNAPDGNDPNGSGIFIKDSTLAHELNHLNGLEHSDDPNNKMYPDNEEDANGVTHSCHRKGTNLTAEQRTTIRDSNVSFAQDVMGNGRGGEVYDDPCDVSSKFIDLVWTQFWMEWIYGRYICHLTAQVDSLSFFDFSEIGFYVETDNDPSTGEPPEGLDYYLAYQPQSGEIIFQRYGHGFGWIPLPPEGISYDFTYAYPDSNLPRIPIGVKLDIPLASFMTLSGSFAFKATATNYVERDLAPDANLLRFSYVPVPIPGDLDLNNKVDLEDLELMTYDWLRIGGSRADLYPPGGDGMVNFTDFAVLANNWMAEIIMP